MVINMTHLRLVAAFTLSMTALWVSAAQETPVSVAAKLSLTVTVTTPQTANLAQKISANGNLAAWQEAVIGAEANGLKITEVRVNVGDRVQRGDVLAVLQADTLRADLVRAKVKKISEPDIAKVTPTGNGDGKKKDK